MQTLVKKSPAQTIKNEIAHNEQIRNFEKLQNACAKATEAKIKGLQFALKQLSIIILLFCATSLNIAAQGIYTTDRVVLRYDTTVHATRFNKDNEPSRYDILRKVQVLYRLDTATGETKYINVYHRLVKLVTGEYEMYYTIIDGEKNYLDNNRVLNITHVFFN